PGGRKPASGAAPRPASIRRAGTRARTSHRGPTPPIPTPSTMRGGRGLVQGYNAQAAVTADQMIVGEMITQEAVDAGLAFDVADTVTDHLDQAGIQQRPDTWTADAGYANEEAFVEAE